jgi:hypothetical protein
MTLTKVLRQVTAGTNYQFLFNIEYSKTVTIKYIVIVFQSLSGVFQVVKQDFADIQPYDFKNLKHVTVLKDIPFI